MSKNEYLAYLGIVSIASIGAAVWILLTGG